MATGSPLVIILIFQLVQTIIGAIGANAINEFAWLAFTKLPFTPKSKASQDELRIRKEVTRVKKELNATSAQDEFTKWAKLRRQLDKLELQYKNFTSSQSDSKSSFKRVVTVARYVGIYGTRFYIQWYYSKQPVYWLPKRWVPWYGEWILSFPSAPMGSVSAQVWQFACSAVLGMVFEAVGALIVLIHTNLFKKTSKQAQPIASEKKAS